MVARGALGGGTAVDVVGQQEAREGAHVAAGDRCTPDVVEVHLYTIIILEKSEKLFGTRGTEE